jgi:hypothetical protein
MPSACFYKARPSARAVAPVAPASARTSTSRSRLAGSVRHHVTRLAMVVAVGARSSTRAALARSRGTLFCTRYEAVHVWCILFSLLRCQCNENGRTTPSPPTSLWPSQRPAAWLPSVYISLRVPACTIASLSLSHSLSLTQRWFHRGGAWRAVRHRRQRTPPA